LKQRLVTTRRGVLRAAAVAAGALGVGAAAAVPGGEALAALTRANPATTLTFMPWWVYWTPAGEQLLNEAVAQFAHEHPGLRAQPLSGPQGGTASTSGVITSILAGQGPDVVADCCTAWVQYLGVNAFENLTPYLQRDNIPLSTWSAGHVQALATQQGQMGLPVYDGPVVYAVNLTILDELGLPYPDSEWTYEDAAKLWRAASGINPTTKQRRYGAGFWWGSGWYASNFLLTGFGGAEMDPTRTKCLLNAPGSVAAGEWIMPLFWDNVLTTDYGNEDNSFLDGQKVMQPRGGWDVHFDAVTLGNKIKWDYWPVPKYPQGRATFLNNDFWGMNAYSKNKEGAWELLKWLTAEDTWQEFVMRATLLEPCKLSLWDKWEYYWQQAAPIFRTKQIKWYKDAALGGYAYPQEFFKYQSTQADNILSTAMSNLFNHKMDVAAAFQQATQQIDALEAAGPAIAAAEKAALAATSKYVAEAKASASAITFPTPPRYAPGSGAQPTDASKYVTVSPSGQVTLLNQGGALQGSTDDVTFAGSAYTSSRGVFTCRLVSVSLPKGGKLNNYPTAKVGLMACSSLGDSAAAVAVFFGANRGVHAIGRPLDGFNLGDERPTSPTAATGLLGQNVIQVTKTPAAGGNWLLKPVWFRLQLMNNIWTPYTSLDGSTWTMAGTPQLVEFVGAWVGVFATSANAKQQIQAVFDHISGFAPTTQVNMGSATD
jgi:ABC-type glycerol-3-phosphate transport system substrate-binding protein